MQGPPGQLGTRDGPGQVVVEIDGQEGLVHALLFPYLERFNRRAVSRRASNSVRTAKMNMGYLLLG
jgi:hypothetical protein